MLHTTSTLIAVDIGNSRVKLGRFDRAAYSQACPEPKATLELPLANQAGEFDTQQLFVWCHEQISGDAEWLLSSVHRGAKELLIKAVTVASVQVGAQWKLRQVAFADVPLVVEVDAPERVGMDRLMSAVAADRLRASNRPAIVVDLGTAIKIGLLTDVGAFVGGAILPGLAMSARALDQQTDALPHVDVERWQQPPLPLGKSTVPAIEAGIFWGAVGAVRELVREYSKQLATPPQILVCGGSSQLVAEVLAAEVDFVVRYVPHLVLSGVAIVDAARN